VVLVVGSASRPRVDVIGPKSHLPYPVDDCGIIFLDVSSCRVGVDDQTVRMANPISPHERTVFATGVTELFRTCEVPQIVDDRDDRTADWP